MARRGIDRLRGILAFRRMKELRDAVGNPGATTPYTVEGEPIIYSIRECLGNRKLPIQHWNNKRQFSKLRCWFRSFLNPEVPAVLIVTFYVTKFPKKTKLTKKQLKEEKTPAVHSWEVCDYLLCLMETLRYSLLANYRQIVKIDAQKFYSSNPRTVFQLMRYDDWEFFYGKHPFYTKAKSFGAPGSPRLLQSDGKKNDDNADAYSGAAK